MKLHLAPFLATAATVGFSSLGNNNVVTAFQVNSLSRNNGRAAVSFVGIQHYHTSTTKRHLASSTARQMAESLAEYDTTSTTTTTSSSSPSSDNKQQQQLLNQEREAPGQVLSYHTTTTSTSSSFAVVKVCEEDLVQQLPTTLTASGVGVTDGVIPMAGEKEEDKVELANALFGKSSKSTEGQQAAKKEGVIGTFELYSYTLCLDLSISSDSCLCSATNFS